MKQNVNVLTVGVGGQGIISLSDIIAEMAFSAGYDVKKSEIHGLSQRGGSVTGHIRWGEKVHAPVIMDGEAHFLLALEELEALRWAHLLRTDGTAIVNAYRITPATVAMGKVGYPEDIAERLAEYGKSVWVNASAIAQEIGNIRASNTVLLGVLSNHLEFTEEQWRKVLKKFFPEKHLDLNLRAFAAGRAATVEEHPRSHR
jgi:indolepyruvate ferredoxin oxidoreductase beta subunit